MSARLKVYVGLKPGKWEVFKSADTPTRASHGDRFAAVIGPFRTMRGARFMADHGRGNPHLQTVGDAERIAKIHGLDWLLKSAKSIGANLRF